MTVNTEFLELEKLRKEIELDIQNIETELARRNNWKQQEEFWQHEARLNSWKVYISIAALAAAFGGIAVKLL